jgi:ankyrin repeat domain-containing protein 50
MRRANGPSKGLSFANGSLNPSQSRFGYKLQVSSLQPAAPIAPSPDFRPLAGRGKTYITSKVIDAVEHTLQGAVNHEGFAFFYCKQTEESRRLALPILQSLVRQLVAPKHLLTTATRPSVHSDIEKLYTEAKLQGSGWTLNLCQKYLTLLLNLYPRTTLVLDALDECNAADRTVLLNTFDSLARNVLKPLKIFISSRPKGDIRQRLISVPNIEITANHNTEDISKFITERMQSQSPWTPVLARNASLREGVLETLVRKSEGMFQYAFLQIGQLMSLDNKRDIQDRLKRLPTGLTSTYDEIYQKIVDRSPYSRDLTLRAIKFVLGSDEPIPITVLGTLVCIDVDTETVDKIDEPLEDVLPGWCASLLTVDWHYTIPVWRPSHFSIVEYFDKLWGMSLVKTFLAKAYLVFLLSEPPPESENKSPVTQYLRRTLRQHIAAEDRPNCSVEVSRLLKSLFSSPGQSGAQYTLWAPELWWCSKEDSATPAIAMSFFSVYYLLQDWWESTDEDDWKFKVDWDGHCLLTLAARQGSKEICGSLLRRGVAVDPENKAARWGSPLVASRSEGAGSHPGVPPGERSRCESHAVAWGVWERSRGLLRLRGGGHTTPPWGGCAYAAEVWTG